MGDRLRIIRPTMEARVRGSAESPKPVTSDGKSPEAAESHELDLHPSLA